MLGLAIDHEALAEIAGRDRKTLAAQFIEQLRRDEMHLPQVRAPRWPGPPARTAQAATETSYRPQLPGPGVGTRRVDQGRTGTRLNA